jgi:hypothetical protein
MCLLLPTLNCENCISTVEYFQAHVLKCCDKKCLDNMYETHCIMCSKELGIEFNREGSNMLFTNIIRKCLGEDEIGIIMKK